MRFKCDTCKTEHDLDQISFGAKSPVQWLLISEEEKSESVLGDERCEIVSHEGKSNYIRTCLEIPIRDMNQTFTWGVWCSVSEASYSEMIEHWDNPNRTTLGPYFGWLCTKIPQYPDTVFHKTMLHQRTVGTRPYVELDHTDHPLAVDQRNGISADRIKKLVFAILHESK